LKEKVLAAHRGGIKTVLIPEENEKDIEDIPSTILKTVELILVTHMDQVLKKALIVQDPENFLKKKEVPEAKEEPPTFEKEEELPGPDILPQ
jgi:ATP-dependent Lon protease